MASAQDHTKEAPTTTQKPTLMEQVKEKVAVVKDKFSGSEHASPQSTVPPPAAQTTKPQTPKGEGFMQKIKDKLPGGHGTQPTTTTKTPAETTEPATTTATSHTDEPIAHRESMGEKISHIFKGGNADPQKTEQKKHEGEGHGVTEKDALKE